MEVLKAENRYPLKSRVFWRRRPDYPKGGYWLVITPSGSRNEFFNWPYALQFANKSVHEEHRYRAAKERPFYPRSNKSW